MKLIDCRFVVTGAARGMGAHFSARLVQSGASVAAGDVDQAGLDRLREENEGAPGRLVTHAVDVSDAAAVEGVRGLGGRVVGGPQRAGQ